MTASSVRCVAPDSDPHALQECGILNDDEIEHGTDLLGDRHHEPLTRGNGRFRLNRYGYR